MLPTMPSGYRWFRGGPGLSRAGRNALFASDDTTVWVWDEETGNPVTDLLDETGAAVSAPRLQDGWVLGAGLPTAVRVASFSLGKDGKRYALEPANSLALTQDAQASAASSASSASASASSAAASAALVGAPADSAIAAAAAAGSGSQTDAALTAGYVPKRFLGMVFPSVVDDYTALQAAADAASSLGRKLISSGTIATSSTLTLGKCSADLSGLKYNYSGTGVAVQWGTQTIGQVNEFDLILGDIVCTTKAAGATWPAGTVGLRVQNTFNCRFTFNKIQNFETGLHLFASSQYGQGGIAYNKFYIGRLMNNLVNLKTELDTSGGPVQPFTNENNFYGGSFSHSDGTYPVAGMRHIQLGTASGSQNNNRFWGCSLEGGREEFLVDCWGNDNSFNDCRWEFVATGNPTPPVRFAGGVSSRNVIRGGYDSGRIVPVESAGSVGNSVQSNQTFQFEGQSDGGLVVSNSTGGSSSGVTVMRAAWRRQGDSTTTGYMARLGPGYLRLKTQADTNDRFAINVGLSNRIAMGPGNAAADTEFGRLAANVFGVLADDSIRTGVNTTANRPSASAVGAGSMFYDSTLSKPIWSDGTTWRDAAGAAV